MRMLVFRALQVGNSRAIPSRQIHVGETNSDSGTNLWDSTFGAVHHNLSLGFELVGQLLHWHVSPTLLVCEWARDLQ